MASRATRFEVPQFPSLDQPLIPVSPPILSITGLESLPQSNPDQLLALYLLLDHISPSIAPNPDARERICFCPGSPIINTYRAFTFSEAVVVLNNLDFYYLMRGTLARRCFLALCLDRCGISGDGAGGGWGLTTTPPRVLSIKTWLECVELYHSALLEAVAETECLMGCTKALGDTGEILVFPSRPSTISILPINGGEKRTRRVAGQNMRERFCSLVWRLVWSPQVETVLGCQSCKIEGLDWDYLLRHVVSESSKFGGVAHTTILALVDRHGRKLGRFGIRSDGSELRVDVMENEEEEEKKKYSSLGNIAQVLDITGRLATIDKRTATALDAVSMANSAAVSIGLPPLATSKPKLPTITNTDAYKTANRAFHKAEKIFRKAEAFSGYIKVCKEHDWYVLRHAEIEADVEDLRASTAASTPCPCGNGMLGQHHAHADADRRVVVTSLSKEPDDLKKSAAMMREGKGKMQLYEKEIHKRAGVANSLLKVVMEQ